MQPIQNIQIGGRRSKSQYQYTIQGTDIAELQRIAREFETRLEAVPGWSDVTSDLDLKNPEAMVDIDRDKAASLGVTRRPGPRDALHGLRIAPGRDDLHLEQRL